MLPTVSDPERDALERVRTLLERLRARPAGAGPRDLDLGDLVSEAPGPGHAAPELAALARALAHGPDPAGAILRASNLRDEVWRRLLRTPPGPGASPEPGAPPDRAPILRLLHQGSYPARLLNLWPEALDTPLHAPPPGRAQLADELSSSGAGDPAAAIARIRTREYLRVALLETDDAPLEVVGGALSDLAAACTDFALRSVDPALAEQVVVFGMGKLGGDELNFLSDIDLLFCHDDALIPAGPDALRVRARLFESLRELVALLEGRGAWRPLFRVDLRLRPFGSRGPLSISRAAMLDYYERHGRPWERQMWLRAHPIAGSIALGEALLSGLRPFVWRRNLSPEIFREIDELMSRARRDAAGGLVGAWRDLKYGPGGIRAVEFFVQGLQLLNGGKNPALRARGTLTGLDRLLAEGLLSDREHAHLTAAYRWLRRVEHRVQLAEGQQTHAVPADPAARRVLAARLAHPQAPPDPAKPDGARREFEATALGHMEKVASITATQTPASDTADPRTGAIETLLDPSSERDTLEAAFRTLGLLDPIEAAGILASLRADANSAFAGTREAATGASLLLRACLDAADPDAALRRLAEFSSRRPAHFAAWRFLAQPEHDAIVRLVAELFSSNEALSQGLVGLAGPRGQAVDEALSTLAEARSSRLPSKEELEARAAALEDQGLSGVALDRALLLNKHAELTRIALHDLARRPSPRAIGAALAQLAELTLRAVVRDLAREFDAEGAEGVSFSFCVIALGKLGMRSMGYGSDLDLVFVYDPVDCAPLAAQAAAVRVTRALRRRLEDRRHGTRLFEVDMRLRPSGRQGLLVTSLDQFARYHTAALPTWERLAALRMRPVLELPFGARALGREGDTRISTAVEGQIRPASVWPDPDLPFAELANDVRALKSRVEAELSRETRKSTAPAGPEARYNAKTGVGGTLELELLVATLQLRAGRGVPRGHGLESRDMWTAIEALGACGAIDPSTAESLADAYTFLRRLLNRLRMTSVGGGEDPDLFAANSPRLAPLARRMGFEDEDVLLAQFLEHRSAVRTAFDRLLS